MTEATLLYRQINPSWFQQGRVTSQAFKPTPKDNKRLSAYDGDQINAEDSWQHYTTELKFTSVGVLAVSLAECTAQELPVEADPEPFPSHCLIKFDECSNSQMEKKAKHLRETADARGWQYQAEPA